MNMRRSHSFKDEIRRKEEMKRHVKYERKQFCRFLLWREQFVANVPSRLKRAAAGDASMDIDDWGRGESKTIQEREILTNIVVAQTPPSPVWSVRLAQGRTDVGSSPLHKRQVCASHLL